MTEIADPLAAASRPPPDTPPPLYRATELIAAYQQLLDLVPELKSISFLRLGRRFPARLIRVPRLRLFLRYFLYVHMERTLTCLRRRYSARAALDEAEDEDEAQTLAIDRFRDSLPSVPKQRTIIFFVVLASLVLTLILARVVVGHIYEKNLSKPLGNVTLATLLLDRSRFVSAVPKFDQYTGPIAVLLLAFWVWLLMLLPVSSYRLKRVLFNLRPRSREEVKGAFAGDHVATSTGLYSLEREVFTSIGGRRPREVQFDLFLHVIITIPLFALGAAFSALAVKWTITDKRYSDALLLWLLVSFILVLPIGRVLWAFRVMKARDLAAPPTPLQLDYASWRRRFVAQTVDIVVIGVLAFLVGVAAGALIKSDDALGAFILVAGAPIASVLLHCAIWFLRPRRRGQTVGKMAVGVRTVVGDGCQIGLGRWIVRDSVLKWFALTCIGIWFLLPWLANFTWPLWDPQKRTFHDIIAGTHVVRV